MPVSDSEDYLDAFMNGFEFILLAMQGRLSELDDETQERVRTFLADYKRVSDGYRARRTVATPVDISQHFGKRLLVDDGAIAQLKN